jgi:hypothetical protein
MRVKTYEEEKLNLAELNSKSQLTQFDPIIGPYFSWRRGLVFPKAEKLLINFCQKKTNRFSILILESLQKRHAIYFAQVVISPLPFRKFIEAENASDFLSFKKPYHFTSV